MVRGAASYIPKDSQRYDQKKKLGVANPSDFTKPFQVRRPARYLPFATALVCGIGDPGSINLPMRYINLSV